MRLRNPSKTALLAHYRAQADDQHRMYRKPSQQHRLDAICNMMDGRREGPVLDVGCGDAFAASSVGGTLSSWVGIDYSAIKLRRAADLGVRGIVADAETLPIASASFDTVLCSELLEHVPRPQHVLGEIARVLRPRGHLILSTPSDSTFRALALKGWALLTRKREWTEHIQTLPHPELAIRLWLEGFNIVDRVKVGSEYTVIDAIRRN